MSFVKGIHHVRLKKRECGRLWQQMLKIKVN